MGYKLKYTRQAEKDARKLEQSGLDKNAIQLLAIIQENPFQNPPPYEKLKIPDRNTARHQGAFISCALPANTTQGHDMTTPMGIFKNILCLVLLLALPLSAHEGKQLHAYKGKKVIFKVVDAFPDVKVKFVDSFGDFKVKVSDSRSFAVDTVKVKIVDSFPDVKLKRVDAFADFEIYME
jgi:hypothetical protein